MATNWRVPVGGVRFCSLNSEYGDGVAARSRCSHCPLFCAVFVHLRPLGAQDNCRLACGRRMAVYRVWCGGFSVLALKVSFAACGPRPGTIRPSSAQMNGACGLPSGLLNDPLRRGIQRVRVSVSSPLLEVTQKSCVPQATKSVLLALMPHRMRPRKLARRSNDRSV